MTSLTVVTSCSKDGWDKYGAKFIETFKQFWPTEVKLQMVSEDFLPCACTNLHLSGLAHDFLTRHEHTGWVHGDGSSPRPAGVAKQWLGNSGYAFRYDAYKFCKKVFAIELIASIQKTGKLFWIDADVVTFAPVPIELLSSLLPENVAISCLARKGYHSECGFVGYNLDHPGTLPFIQQFANLYAEDRVFNLNEWHDSWTFDWLRAYLKTETYEIPHKSVGHPFIASQLGKFMDHLKGARKKQGRTPAFEQVSHKNVEYWK